MAEDTNVSTPTDVTEEVVDTSTDSSPETETSTDDSEVETAGTEETKTKSQSVPYDRFEEVNSSLKEEREARLRMEQELNQLKTKVAPEVVTPPDPQTEAIKEQLRELGFVRQEDIDKELKQRELDRQVQDEISRLETSIDGKDGRPKFDRSKVIKFALERQIGDLETAYEKLHQQDLINWHIEQAISKSKGTKSEASDGSGVKNVGTTNDDLKEAIKKGDKDALRTLLKRQFAH